MNSAFSGDGAEGFIKGPEDPPKSDIVTTFHHEDGKDILRYEQDVEPVLEAIKRGETRPWLSKEKEFKAVAEIPVIVLAEWARKQGMTWQQVMEDDKALRRFINDPDNSGWRIK